MRIASRVLRALKSMSDATIPRELIKLVDHTPSAELAYQIAQTLIEGTGGTYRGYRGVVLPMVNNAAQRKSCAADWARIIQATRWGAGQAAAPAPAVGAPKPPAWEPDADSIKLLAVTAHYASAAAAGLKSYRWGLPAPPPDADLASPTTVVAPDLGGDLVGALEAFRGQVLRLLREHPKAKSFSAPAETIETTTGARLAASDGALQQAAVSLDATGGLLELLVRACDAKGELQGPLAKARSDRRQALANVKDVVRELRESCYYNLVLLDLLVRCGS